MKGNIRIKYQQTFSKLVGAFGSRAFCLGRQGLVVLLKALGVKSGDKVGVCGFTCFAVVEAVKVCGAKPVYLDVDKYLCIDPEEVFRQKAGSLKVVILQHTFGVPGQLDRLLSACKQIGAAVVEDCAHAISCFWDGAPLGSFGEGAVYSFQWGKPYTTGQGGMLTVNSAAMLDEVDNLLAGLAEPTPLISARIAECKRLIFGRVFGSRYENFAISLSSERHERAAAKKSLNPERAFHFHHGYVRFASESMAAAGLKQLENWPRIRELRRHNTDLIKEIFNKSGLPLWPVPPQSDITMLRYPLLVPNKSVAIQLARRKRIDLAGWYSTPVHPLRGDDLAKVGYKAGSCRRAEELITKLVHIPTGTGLRMDMLDIFIDILNKAYR